MYGAVVAAIVAVVGVSTIVVVDAFAVSAVDGSWVVGTSVRRQLPEKKIV